MHRILRLEEGAKNNSLEIYGSNAYGEKLLPNQTFETRGVGRQKSMTKNKKVRTGGRKIDYLRRQSLSHG